MALMEIYTLSLHDALPILTICFLCEIINFSHSHCYRSICQNKLRSLDRKSTRLNSSHVAISYAVFCLKKKSHETKTHSDIVDGANISEKYFVKLSSN